MQFRPNLFLLAKVSCWKIEFKFLNFSKNSIEIFHWKFFLLFNITWLFACSKTETTSSTSSKYYLITFFNKIKILNGLKCCHRFTKGKLVSLVRFVHWISYKTLTVLNLIFAHGFHGWFIKIISQQNFPHNNFSNALIKKSFNCGKKYVCCSGKLFK